MLGKGIQTSKDTQLASREAEVKREQILSDERQKLSGTRDAVPPPTVGQTTPKT